jgi:type VI secretion system secreted protein VgrG
MQIQLVLPYGVNTPLPDLRHRLNAAKMKSLNNVATPRNVASCSLSLLILVSVLALVAFTTKSHAGILNSAESFAVLGNSTVTNTGNTVLNGNLGIYSGTSITGFYPPGIVNGTTHLTDAVAQQAQADALAGYILLVGETYTQDLTG